jgi:hypothetical protein
MADLSVDDLRFHIQRYDALRSSTANRASIVLAGTALVLASTSLLYSLDLRSVFHENLALITFVVVLLLAVVLLIVACVWNAVRALVTLRGSRGLYGDFPFRGLYNQTDIVTRCGSYDAFEQLLASYTYEVDFASAKADLWVGVSSHYLRYQRLRSAIRLLSAATLVFMVASTATLIASTLWPA